MSIVSRIRELASNQDGGITVEAVLWLPFFFIFSSLIADTAFILHGQAQAQRIVQDVNRGYSTGLYTSVDEMEEQIEKRLHAITGTAKAKSEATGDVILTVVEMNAGDMVVLGFIPTLRSVEMRFAHYHIVES